jgi:phospholipase/carboxylesterase
MTTGDDITASVIWLHGLGASGHDFAPIVQALPLPQGLGVRFVFPHAPERPVTINGGVVMPAWYDILSMSIEREVDSEQLRLSARQTMALVEREIQRGVPSENIVLAGFSQGGAVVYEAALSSEHTFAGLLVLSSYFATSGDVHYHPANRALPIQIMHGDRDPVVPPSLGQQALEILTEKGYDAELKTYSIDHSVCLPQVTDIGHWLGRVLTAKR